MNRIQLLSETLTNQIAAGEVIESPASVVKELVENAIDAQSTKIDVIIKDGGLKEITVIDDGMGIPSNELRLAITRYATSKIATKRDLFQVETLGFRGEALAAIASVSKLTVTSATKDQQQGAMISVAEGVITNEKPATARKGTEVIVEDLFFATPKRYKHTKDLNREAAKIVDLMNRFVLSHPEIRFQLKKDGKVLLQTTGNGDLKQAVARVYGVGIAKKMLQIQKEDLDFEISGYISLPELTRASKNYITLIVNGRFVRSNELNKALIEGYGSKLMIGKYPIVVLDIKFDSKLVDVNVHPTKQEIRLSKEEQLKGLISQAVKEVLGEETLIPDGYDNNLTKRMAKRNEQLAIDLSLEYKEPKVQEETELYEAEQKIIENLAQNELEKETTNHWANDSVFDDPFEEKDKNNLEEKGLNPKEIIYHKQETKDSEGATLKDYLKLANQDHLKSTQRFPHLEYFGQLHGTYLFAQNETGMYIIDQHAAQERIKYEEYRVKIGEVNNNQQQLLIPLIFHFSLDEALKIEESLADLKKLGVYLESFGQNSYILHTHPTWINNDIEDTIQDLIDLYLQDNKITIAKFREATAIMMSCKRSIKANHHLNDMQARQLLKDLAKCENPFNCPHGRPVLVQLTNYDLERMFKRIQDPH